MFRPNVISAIASRNIKTFFTNVTGYLFIVCFVVVSGIIAFGPRFFADNLATLDQLTNAYPLLLMFLIPAFTMGIWADEKRQGTDAILFTLPASDAEILFGKFLSVVVVYLAALFFSLAQLIALASIGTPDWGVIFSTYVGYFLAGVSLLSIGMFASSLTSHTTVAFVTGASLCSIPVFVGQVAPTSQFLQSFSIEWQLKEFGQGSIALSNFLYFVALTAIGLFLNLVVITKRHWATDEEVKLYWLYGGQVLSILVIAGSLYAISAKIGNYYDTELDLTSQGINTLSPTSIDVIKDASGKRKVYIQAYVSDQVPTEFVATKKRLLRLLRQYSQLGGDRVELRVVNITPNSKHEKEATNAGIRKIDHVSEVGGREIRQNVFLGLKFSSSIGESVIPQITVDTPIEYELTRAIGTVGVRKKKLRLGVLDTHAAFMGLQIPMAPVSYEFNHTVVDRLKQRYDLVRVSEADLAKMIEQQKAENKKADSDSDSKKADGSKSNPDDEKKADDKDGKNKSENDDESEKKDSETKDEDADDSDEKKEDDPRIVVPDVLLVVRPSRVQTSVQEQIVEYMTLGNPTVFMVDPLAIYPFTVFNGDGSIPESPKQRVVADQGGLFIVDEENNDCSTLFDALNVKWHGKSQSVTFPAIPGRPNQFGGPPQGGRPARTVDAFFPTVVSQTYRPFEELRWDDLVLSFRIGNDVRENGLSISEERDGVPVSLGSPNALMINAIPHDGFDPFNRNSQITSGINNVLMFYAGGIKKTNSAGDKKPAEDAKKDEKETDEKSDDGEQEEADTVDKVEFIPLISVEQDAIGVDWNDITKIEKRPAQGFPPREQEFTIINPNPEFYAIDLRIEELGGLIEKAKAEKKDDLATSLTSEKAALEKRKIENNLEEVCLAAHIQGTSRKGNPINAVILTDSDMASNLYGAIEDNLDRKPDNVEFLLNIVDTLGGREEFVALRARNPVQRTLTFMDLKRSAFRSSRLEKEKAMRRAMQAEIIAERRRLEEESKDSENSAIGFITQFEGVMKAQKKLDIKEKKLQAELDDDISELKAEEARNLKETEGDVRLQATILPCLPALILGIIVFIFRFLQERSFVNEKRRS